jgi:hypothetical protein
MRTATIIAALLVALLVAHLASAQTMIPIPAYNSTFSVSGAARGFYFQVPVDFTVVGLRVPDEKKHGKQNVCLFKHTAGPPPFSQTVNLTTVFKKFGEPSANIIPCSINYTKGDWLIVIGACGDTTIMHNSYGPSGCFGSRVFGQPVSLCRCGTQFNIVSRVPPYPIFSENGGPVCRVEVYVASAKLVGSGTGKPGTTIKFALTAAADANLPYLMGSSLGNGPIPIDTRQLGLSPDNLLVLSTGGLLPSVFQNYAGNLDAAGAATAALNIPNFPVLKGVRVFTAFLTLKAAAPSGVASISNTFLFTIA